jgi:predicted XRE-type DNA-binding protein
MSQAWHQPTPGDQIKRDLAKAIALIIDWRELKQVEAAKLMRISPSKLSVLLQYARDSNLQVGPLSAGKMLECINLLGVDVDLIVRRPRSNKPQFLGQTRLGLA